METATASKCCCPPFHQKLGRAHFMWPTPRPWYVWSENSTRGHALVVMLAYLMTRYLQHAWSEMDLTVEEGLHQLSMLCAMEIVIHNQSAYPTIPTPDPTVATLLEAAQVRLPKVLPHLGAHVVSRKKLPSRRKPFEANRGGTSA